jgi:hypothetical protein
MGAAPWKAAGEAAPRALPPPVRWAVFHLLSRTKPMPARLSSKETMCRSAKVVSNTHVTPKCQTE